MESRKWMKRGESEREKGQEGTRRWNKRRWKMGERELIDEGKDGERNRVEKRRESER